jgi:hypothetical protein
MWSFCGTRGEKTTPAVRRYRTPEGTKATPSPDSTSVRTPRPIGRGVHDIRRKACRGAERNNAIDEPRRHLAIAEDKAFGGQCFDGDRLSGERMVARQDDNTRIAIEELGAEGAVEGRLERKGEGYVDLSAGQRLHLLRRAHFVEREFNVRVEFAVVADDSCKEAAGTPQEETMLR